TRAFPGRLRPAGRHLAECPDRVRTGEQPAEDGRDRTDRRGRRDDCGLAAQWTCPTDGESGRSRIRGRRGGTADRLARSDPGSGGGGSAGGAGAVMTRIAYRQFDGGVSADGRSPVSTEIGSPPTTSENVPPPMGNRGGGTHAGIGGLHRDSSTGATGCL